MPIIFAALVLTAMGLVSIQAWSVVQGGMAADDGRKQLVFFCFAVAGLLLSQWVNYRKLLALSGVFYILSLLPVLYTVAGRFTSVPLVRPINGSCHWILFGPISFQPSEVAKLTLVMLLAWSMRNENPRGQSWGWLLRALLLAALPLGLVLEQPDLGTALTMIPPVLLMIYAAGVKLRYLGILGLVGLLVAPVLWFSGTCHEEGCTICPQVPVLRALPQFVKHYQRARVYAMFTNDPRVMLGKGYQQQRALETLGSGGLKGKGAGNIPIGRGVPEGHTDMVLALIGEQFGLTGIGIVLLAYSLLFASGLTIAAKHLEGAGRMLALGLVTLLAGQMLLNMMVCLRLMPVTGVTLPFVSYGGTSLVTSYLAIGLLLNVARNQPRRRSF